MPRVCSRYSLTINPDGLVTGTGSRPVRPSGMDLQITGKVQMDREGPGANMPPKSV